MTKRVYSKFFPVVAVFLITLGCINTQQDDTQVGQVELWASRIVETVAQVVSDPTVDKYEVDYYVDLAALALGQNGRVEDAFKLFDRIGLNQGCRKTTAGVDVFGGWIVDWGLSVVQLANPGWTEVVYRDANSAKIQAELAINCLLAFSQKRIPK